VTDTGTVSPQAAWERTGCVIYDRIQAHAQSRGGSAALVDRETVVSYAALPGRVDELAGRLQAHGVRTGHPVPVLLDRSIAAVVAMLAVLAAGGVYCPVEVTAPRARTAKILAGLGARVAIANGPEGKRLPSGIACVHPATAPSAHIAFRTDARPHPDALAYVMHTSGSTGAPKGVAMTHRGLSRLINWQVASGTPGLRTLQFTSASFDVTFQEVLSTLATGGCLVVASEEVRRDPVALLRSIVARRIERIFLPYVALQQMAVAAKRLSLFPESLRHVVTAGERLIITPAIRALFLALPHCRLDNHYGPTEAHLVTSFTLPADRQAWPPVPPIGSPVREVCAWVLDDRLKPVPEGEVGELYVGGSGLAAGYLGDAALTASRFVASPVLAGAAQASTSARLYRTGDLARASADGTYDFAGRADSQLKVRGYRIEPAEVESALLRHPRMEAAAVGVREVADGMSVLTAYLQTDGPVSHRDIADHVRRLLPSYMVPSRYLTVAVMPRTASGKVDTSALADLELPTIPESWNPVSSAGVPLTEAVTAIWTRVLGHDEFDSDDDFFDVGGDSLLATWVVAELGQALGHPVELSVFLEDSTIDGLVRELTSMRRTLGERPRSSQIRTLRPGPSGRALYLVHPLGGELICYRDLCRASRAPIRILGISWTGEPPSYGSSLPEIARVHVEQLCAVQPEGPYLLGGWSFGGVLAYEIAQQLSATGAAVDFLGLLDANPVTDPLSGLPIARAPFLGILEAVLAQLDDPAATPSALADLTSSEAWLQLMGVPMTASVSSEYLRTVLATARTCMAAAMRYRAQPYPGQVHLFQAAASGAARQAKLATAVQDLCGGRCVVMSVPGDHWGFIRAQHVTETATQLDAALEKAGGAGRTRNGS
jgi:amino acid adenylation domain-containing protein